MTSNEDYRIQRIEEMAERHERDMYRGNGKPGLTTRMEKMEEAFASIKESMGRVRSYFVWIVMLLISLVAKEIVVLIFKK